MRNEEVTMTTSFDSVMTTIMIDDDTMIDEGGREEEQTRGAASPNMMTNDDRSSVDRITIAYSYQPRVIMTRFMMEMR